MNLLIVDDEPQTRLLLSEILSQMGHRVRSAKDGFSALDEIREAKPDVLLSDLNMPGMSGFELLSVVRRRLPGIYVIATSGAYTGAEVPDGIAADAFYEKASSVHTLLGLLKNARLESERMREAETPIWTAAVRDEAGTGYVMLSCPECLRAFAPVVEVVGSQIHDSECGYCHTPVRYAIVQPLDPQTSQPFGITQHHVRLPQGLAEAQDADDKQKYG